MALPYTAFLKTLPQHVLPHLPGSLQGIQSRQPWRWLVQFHYGEPWLHYEVSRPRGVEGLELGFHCESRDKELNRYLLLGFRRHLFEIKSELGESIEAEMWDRGWTKIYEVLPSAELTEEYQEEVGRRLAEIIICLHPIYVQLRNDVARIHR
jgi:hypothetical protein